VNVNERYKYSIKGLAKNGSFAFLYLQEVVKAHIDRFPQDGTNERSEKVIEDITKMYMLTSLKCLKSFGTEKVFMGSLIFN